MESYGQPHLIATYSIEELLADAALAQSQEESDQLLKDEIERVDRPLERLGAIRTGDQPR